VGQVLGEDRLRAGEPGPEDADAQLAVAEPQQPPRRVGSAAGFSRAARR
jgi:hypothetical protein